jgi:acetoacetyl-CoA synthetase
VHLVVDAGSRWDAYAPLVQALVVDRPVHGLQPRLADLDAPRDTLPAIARQALADLREIQPEGPYTLAGHAFGGLVAYEVACLLRAAGEQVDHLALIDVPPPVAALPSWQARARRWSGLLAAVRAPDRSAVLFQRFVDRFAPATATPERQQDLRAREIFDAHRPSAYDGPIDWHSPEVSLPLVGDGRSAWRRRAPRLVVRKVAGTGADLLGHRSVDALAAHLSAALR